MPTKPQIERRNAVLAHLRRHGPATAREVSEALDIHYTTANDDLHTLRNEGKVEVSPFDSATGARRWVLT